MKVLKPNRAWPIAIGLLFLLNPLLSWSATCDHSTQYVTMRSPIVLDLSINGPILYNVIPFEPFSFSGCDLSGAVTLKFTGAGTPNNIYYPMNNVPGLSYFEKLTLDSVGWDTVFMNNWPASLTTSASSLPTSQMFPGGSILMYFSKTGSTGNGGTFGPQEIAIFSINGMPVHTIYLANQVEIVAKRQACNVTQSATSVTLTDTTAVELSSVGSTSKDQQFYIPLNCSANTNISLSFSGDLADSSNAVFSNLSGDANADSVGVQILNGGKPVPTASNTYLKLGLVNGSLSVPLTARYYALKNNALAGSVKAVVTANIIYN